MLYLVPGETGGSEVVAREVVPRLAAQSDDLQLTAFVNDEAAPVARELVGERVQIVHLPVSGRSRVKRVLAEQYSLVRALRKHDIQLLHNLASTGPAFPRVPSVVTVLDVIYAIEPQAHTRALRLGMKVLVPMAARRAERVITISDSAAAEIAEVLKIDRRKIDVTYLAGRPPGPATAESELRDRFELGEAPLVLSVSARRPHKNLASVLEAFAAVNHVPKPVLVLPGYPTISDDELKALAATLGIADRVRFLGWIDDADIDGLYKAAACFVFASRVEGFGLPVLEALERAVPVACSDIPSLNEVAGDAALRFNPGDVDEMTAAIERLLGGGDKATELRAAGPLRAARFSWDETARLTLESYRRAWASG
jgi:glycosyltransferase involved in cell wall biosynthesis